MQTFRVLAVDDEPFNLDLIELAFLENTNIELIKAKNGQEAIDKLDTSIDVVLLDIRMPVMDGKETLKIIKENEKLSIIPVIMVTANSEEKYNALKLGADDFLSKPIDIEELKLRTLNNAKLKKAREELANINKHLDNLVEIRTKELQSALKLAKETEYEISLRLGRASEFRDLETGGHIKRMSRYSALLGKLLGFSKEEEQLLLYASPLHDIGKIGIPDAILLKPARFTAREYEIMKQHTTIGEMMLDDSDDFPVIKIGKLIAKQHHEKFDGSGYPLKLKGDEIHIYARIVAIADVFDALSSKRVYKEGFSIEKSLVIMKEGKGTHFDPEILELFLNNIDKFLKIKEDFPDSEEIPNILNIMEMER